MATTTINVNASFTGLSDTPSSYTGQAGKAVFVKMDESGLEFGTAGGGYNLFTANLTLGANRTHDMNGNSLTFLKSKVEFRASDGLSSNKALVVRNHLNTGDLVDIRNNGDFIVNKGNFEACYIGGGTGSSAQSTLIGHGAGFNDTKNNNTFVGRLSGYLNTGEISSAFGDNALRQNIGQRANAFGYLSGETNLGDFVSFYGTISGYRNKGSRVVGFGESCGQANEGNDNVFVGYRSGYYESGTTENKFSSSSVYIGSLVTAGGASRTNQIVIGYNAVGEGSNTARIGNSSVTELHVGGNGAALALKSPNGTTWRISVDNSGTLVIV